MIEKPFIFIGPTIALKQAQQYLDAVYLPPIKYGDVYKITELYQPKIIGIVDGYFNQVPAVWHKEILWAINQGISVFGSSSMGALRAAELDQYGMQGCGKIYQAYQSQILPPFIDEPFEDDDEVAVVHGPAELSYKASSEAMVNIRFTLTKAHQQNIIDQPTLTTLVNIAKTLFYPERNYSKILEIAKQHGLTNEKLETLGEWINDNQVDQKQIDAITMLNKIKEYSKNIPESSTANHLPFQHTSQWQTAITEIEQSHYQENSALNELRLTGESYLDSMDQALSSTLIDDKYQPLDSPDALSKLHELPDLLDQLFARHWQFKDGQSTAEQLSPIQCDQILLSYLHRTGKLASLSLRSEDKNLKLNQLEKKPNINSLNEIDILQLSDWYFTEQLGEDLPDQIEDYASQLGFTDMDSFYDMILKEYYYLESKNKNGTGI